MKTNVFGQIDLTKGRIVTNLVAFTIPFLLAYFLNSLYSAIDLFFIGQFSSPDNIAAVSNGTTVMFVVNSIILGLATGGTVVIGQYFGAKIKEGVANATRNLIIFMSVIAILLTITMFIISFFIGEWLKLETEAAQITQTYLRILSAGIPLYVGYATISAILRGLGNSFLPLIFVAAATITNIGLDALFIITLNMGAIGAAIATIIGQGVSFLVGLIYLLIKPFSFKLCFKKGIQGKTIAKIVRCGLPVAIQDGLVVLSFLIILAAINQRGVIYSSVVGVTDRVTSFCFVPLSAFGTAISTATAQNMGASEIKRTKSYMKWGLLFCSLLGLVLGGLCELIPGKLASLFAGNNAEIIELAIPYIRSTAIDIFVCALVFPINAVFIGSGHTIFAMAQNLGVTFALRIPLALIFANALNQSLFVIGLAYPISTFASLIAVIIFYLSNKWTKLKFVSTTNEVMNT